MAASHNAATRMGGMALMVGIVLSVLASVFHPGGPIIDTVDQTDFVLAIQAMADNAGLAHLMTLFTAVGMLLYIYGFSTLWPLANQGRGSPLLKAGIGCSMFGWASFVVAMSMRHLTVHLMQRASDAGPAVREGFEGLALSTYVAMAGVVLTLIIVYPFGSAMTGIALARRFSSGNMYKLASQGLVVIGVGGLVIYLMVLFAGIEPVTLLMMNVVLLWIGSVCLFIIGWGMYQGRRELTPAA